MSTAKLTYCEGRGRAEAIRYVLGAAGIPFEEEFLREKEALEALRASGKLLFRQIPLLEIDGLSITQSEAIIRYIARKHNLYGTNEEERVRIDMIYDAVKDSSIGLFGLTYIFRNKEQQDELKTNGFKEKTDKYFPMFERILKEGSGYFVGSQISFVDAVFVHDLEWMVDILGEESLEEYPVIREHRDRVIALPNLKAFLSSPQKKPFPDDNYKSEVMAVFYGK